MPEKRANADISAVVAAAKERAAAVKARIEAQRNAAKDGSPAAVSPSPGPSVSALPKKTGIDFDAMRAKLAAMTNMKNSGAQPRPAPQPALPEREDALPSARGGGLGIGLHPLLMGDGPGKDTGRGKQVLQPKFATTMANRRTDKPKKQLDLSGPNFQELKENPYFDSNLAATGRNHKRELVFHQTGKFVKQAINLRRQAAMEEMKKKIAKQTAKLIDEGEKVFLVPAPPETVEWWDEGLLDLTNEKGYDSTPKIDTEDSIVTMYIQHPVPIEPPQEKHMPVPKPMYLTKTEQAKLRRQRRMADHKEQQAKIRLGLEPPPPPKVKKSNLMRVLGEQAVKDPTAVEARVNREIAERKQAHEETNESRKLTQEEKLAKLAQKQQADAAAGLQIAVFKIDSLSNSKHRYLLDINAKQWGNITGLVLAAQSFSLVICEGGSLALKKYKHLLLNRIKWNENSLPSVQAENEKVEVAWLQAVDDKGELKDLSFNKCQLIFEGQKRQRSFKRWGGIRTVETDAEAKTALERAKMEHFWTLAKSTQ